MQMTLLAFSPFRKGARQQCKKRSLHYVPQEEHEGSALRMLKLHEFMLAGARDLSLLRHQRTGEGQRGNQRRKHRRLMKLVNKWSLDCQICKKRDKREYQGSGH